MCSNPCFVLQLCVFPFFPMGKNGEKSIWKEREMNTFPFLSIYFFPHGEKWENTHFSMGKNGVGPPPPLPPSNPDKPSYREKALAVYYRHHHHNIKPNLKFKLLYSVRNTGKLRMAEPAVAADHAVGTTTQSRQISRKEMSSLITADRNNFGQS